jgi:hypothetical protein
VLLLAAELLSRDVLAQSPRLIKIGALTESWGPTPAIVGLRDGLQELGYRDDKDFTIGVRFTEGKAAELPAAARDLVRHGVDVIVTTESGTAAKAAQAATNEIPIVFVGSGDPVGLGLVKSIARPSGNITGVADLDSELVPKRMEMFRELIPGLKRVLVPYDETNADAVASMTVHREAARRLGLTLVERPLRGEEQARAAMMALRKGDADGIFSLRFLGSNISGFILQLAPRALMPTMFHIGFFVERGWLGLLFRQPLRARQTGGPSRRQDREGRQAGRPSRRAAVEVRDGDQSENGEGARVDDSARAPTASRSAHRVAMYGSGGRITTDVLFLDFRRALAAGARAARRCGMLVRWWR